MTAKEMCEFIAAVWRIRYDWQGDPYDIWTMDRRGEVWPVVEAYEDARAWADANPDAFREDR